MTRRTIRTAACSAFALATALAAAPAAAQMATGSFQGTPTVTFGSATVTEGSGTTDVAVNSASAVIDWTPDDTAINNGVPILFQPAGTTATYSGAADFAVLNRIVPTDISRGIIFDGTVLSRVAGLSGGTVFFYSPGGIIIGANAFFDIGNLGLTTAEPVVDASGNWYTGNTVQFQQAASTSKINIDGQITASAEGSYVAAFAPFVDVAGVGGSVGSIDVNGQVALVAGEAGTITFSPDGLFDIQVTIGSDGNVDGTGIFVDGEITGPASSGPGDNHRIYMVAMPKNSALSIAFGRGASVGFDIAGAADTVGNAVILSAGRNVVGDAFVASSRVAGGTIDINDSSTGSTAAGIDFTSQVTAVASDTVHVDVFRQTNFASNAILVGDVSTEVFVSAIPADSTGSLTVGGNLFLDSDFANFPGMTEDAGVTVLFASDGGSVDVAGDLTVRAVGVNDRNGDGVVEGGTALVNLNGGFIDVGGTMLVQSAGFNDTGLDVVGGNSQVNLSGASGLTVGGVLRIDSYGIAGPNNGQMGAGGDGTGGFSGLQVAEGSTVTTNELSIVADGVGGADAGAGGGTGTGGVAQIVAADAGSSLTVVSQNVTGDPNLGELDTVSAEGFGGQTALAGGTGGNAFGGDVNILASAGAQIALPNSSTFTLVTARAFGGTVADSGIGGGAFGGDVNVVLDGATMTGEGIILSSFAQGGSALMGATGVVDGGDGTGGTRSVTLVNGANFTGSVTGGGPGGSGGDGSATGTGGDGTGGLATLTVDGSTLNVTGDFLVFSQTNGGAGGTGGNGVSGTAFAQIINGGVVNLSSGAVFHVSANSFGSLAPVAPGVGGNATGGAATLLVENGTISGPGAVEVLAIASGADVTEGQGGNATGGTAHLQLRGATISVSDIFVDASAGGGWADPALLTPPAAPGPGNGGNATGGFALVTAETGVNTLTVGALNVDADGLGGNASGSSGNGGLGNGGQSTLVVDAGASLAINGSVSMSADAEGGVAGFFEPMTSVFNGTGTGGDAVGGNVHLFANGGTLTVSGDVELEGEADAGMGVTGGNATAGEYLVQANGGSIAIAGSLAVEADAFGGDGTTAGGNATGSLDNLTVVNAFLLAENGGSVTVGGTTTLATTIEGGAGGNGGTGGNAAGGATLLLAVTNTSSSLSSSITLNDLIATTTATGGSGGSVLSGSGATGGAGGNADAGTVNLLADAGNGSLTVNGTLTAEASGFGGAGGDGDVGGAGGYGQGGFVEIGTRSGPASADNTGSASFANIVSTASGVGGDGGQGFVGAGGAGGEGGSGRATLLVRGSTVDISGSAQLIALGAGGDGGTGAGGDGAGGDGFINGGGVGVVASNRFQIPGDRGQLNAAAISGSALAQGGIGSTNGAAILGTSGANVSFLGADGNIGSLSISVAADQVTSTTPDLIEVKNGDVTVGSFSFVTANDLVLDLDTATLTAADYLTDSRSIQLPPAAPAVAGTVIATNSFGIFTDLGFDTLTYVNFDVVGGINFNNPGNFQTGNLDVDGDIIMTTTGNLVTGNLTSTGQIVLTTDGDQTVGDVTSGGATSFNVDGALLAGQVTTGGDFDTLVDGDQTIGDVVAGGTVDIRGMSNVTVGSIMGAASVYVISDGGIVTTGAIDAGDPATDGRRFGIALRGTALNTGNLTTVGPVIAAAQGGGIALGNVASGDSILLLGDGNIATGSLTGGAAPGTTIYIGGTANLDRLGTADDFQPIIAVDPTPTGGSVTLGGPVSADRVLVAAGGLAAINGMVSAPFVQFLSGDIAIGTAGGIDAGTGMVRLVSSNSSGMFVGDGGSAGYTLNGAEFSRVRGHEIFIAGVDGSSAIDMTIGDLAILGNQTGPDGTVVFATGDLATMTSSGGIRVDGEVVATNQTANNYLEFYADLIEVNAQTGGIRSYSGSAPSGTGSPGLGALGGIVLLEANNIHVASDEILQQLRADPFYEGHANDLNQPGEIDRPNGVLTALGIEFYPGQTLYIQNTGSAENPAGFYATVENSDIDPFVFEGNGDAEPEVEVVINGQFASEGGDVSGQDAFQLIVDNAESLAGFSSSGQVNGCSFDTGACGPPVVEPEEEAPPPTNAAEIEVLTEDQPEEEAFEAEDDEEESEQAASAPIAPPVVLINTGPLNPDVDVTDPVSGTGNPALIGAGLRQDAQGDQQ